MTDHQEVEVVEPSQAVDIARPVISPDEAQRMVKDLRELIAKILVANKHYQRIRNKDVLLKAGAEELGKFFGLSSGYSDLDTESVGEVFYASVKCSVSNSQGRVLAESYGFYGSDEHRGKCPANTVVKMAQKRAFVGAIITATGTSELFTQDVEDVPADEPREDRMTTTQEKEALLGLFMRKGGKTPTEAGAWLTEQGQKADSYLWWANTTLALVMKPDFDAEKNTDSEVVPTEPEIPTEPSALNPDDTIEFGEVVE